MLFHYDLCFVIVQMSAPVHLLKIKINIRKKHDKKKKFSSFPYFLKVT